MGHRRTAQPVQDTSDGAAPGSIPVVFAARTPRPVIARWRLRFRWCSLHVRHALCGAPVRAARPLRPNASGIERKSKIERKPRRHRGDTDRHREEPEEASGQHRETPEKTPRTPREESEKKSKRTRKGNRKDACGAMPPFWLARRCCCCCCCCCELAPPPCW